MAIPADRWEVEMDGGWEPFCPGVPFRGSLGEEFRYERGRFQYRVAFTKANAGVQENMRTGRTRRLRLASSDAAEALGKPPDDLRSRGIDLQWRENLRMLRQQVLSGLTNVSDASHPAHAGIARANAAEELGNWEVAFNELFVAQEALSAPSGSSASQRGDSSSSQARQGLKRTASARLCEASGEPRRVARRLLQEAGGDENAAFERALLIRDLEHGQVELNSREEECSICTERVGVREAIRLRPCLHGWYCVTCFQRAVDAKMADGATLQAIGCPECRRSISEALLRALLTKKQMEKLHRQDLEAAVASCATLRPCPTPDCRNLVALEDGVQPRLRCDLCRKEHCLLCSASPYHVGQTCEEHLASLKDASAESALKKWMAEVGAKQCPKCRAVVTKHNLRSQATQAEECHKMICRGCRTRFCFGCLAILSETSTCGCTPDNHGFIDPDTGQFVQHLDGGARRRRRRS